MADRSLDIRDDLTGIGLIPPAVKVFGRDAKLDDEVGGQVLRLDLTALFPPRLQEGGFVTAHDDPGVGTADEMAAIPKSGGSGYPIAHLRFSPCSLPA